DGYLNLFKHFGAFIVRRILQKRNIPKEVAFPVNTCYQFLTVVIRFVGLYLPTDNKVEVGGNLALQENEILLAEYTGRPVLRKLLEFFHFPCLIEQGVDLVKVILVA